MNPQDKLMSQVQAKRDARDQLEKERKHLEHSIDLLHSEIAELLDKFRAGAPRRKRWIDK